MRSHRLTIFLLIASLTLAAAPFVPRVLEACGPYFSVGILPSRTTAAIEPPPAMAIVAGLVPTPGDHLPVHEDQYDDPEHVRATAEAVGLSADVAAGIASMRALPDGDAAYAAGAALPEAVRAYTAGAVSFHHQQFDQAKQYFQRVLTLNVGEGAREQRIVWASYMLGSIARLQGDDEAAATHWAMTRGLVRAGAPDPLGLAVASFGEEARLALRPGTVARAVALYARQAAYGSEIGTWSLLEVADRLLHDQALLDEAVRDDTSRRLVLRYLYAHGLDDARSWDSVTRLVDALDRQQPGTVDGADLLAASAYAAGKFDIAARFAGYQKTPLASWITGKLALRAGDREGALAAFAKAIAGFPAHQAARSRVEAETALLHVTPGEYEQALELFYGAVLDGWSRYGASNTDYWHDLAYLAERVLTIDELLPVVDRIAPPPSRTALAAATARDEELPAVKLRTLTARRLMRARRYHDALKYLDDEHLRHSAEEYVNAVTKANNRWRGRSARAEAAFAAATIARHDGMELLGFEAAPDYAVYDGAYAPEIAIEPATPDERARVDASGPAVPSRFHYRLTAVDHAMTSASLVPHTSQAFAAVLCHATGWIIDRDPARAAAIYARYVREGPLVPWASHFGRNCPEPDFAAADRRRWQERLALATWVFHRHPRRVVAAAGLAVAAATVWIAWRRRHRIV